MSRNLSVRSFTVVAVVVGIVGVSLALANAQGPSGQRGPQEDPPEPDRGPGFTRFRPVSLEYVGGESCIDVHPERATIWRGSGPKKLKRIRWTVIDNNQFDDLYWEIRWDDSKAGASDDFFGDRNVPCGDNMHKAKPDEPGAANASWPYSVEVWKCVDGEKSGAALCKVDPWIDWGN